MNTEGFFGGFYRISEWVTRIAVANLLWLLTSLPFVFVGAIALFEKNVNAAFLTLLVAIILAPFTVFPASAALFAVARKWVLGELELPKFKWFMTFYKATWKKSMQGGLIYAPIFLLEALNIRFYSDMHSTVGSFAYYFFLLLLILSLIGMLNFFSLLAHVELPLKNYVRNSLIFGFVRPHLTLVQGLLIFGLGLLSYKVKGLFLFVPFSVSAWLFYAVFHRIFERLAAKS
jgi:uncharacterized membrane protein YesL